MNSRAVRARFGIACVFALVVAGCSSTGSSKTALWQTVGAINYPFVQVMQTGAQMETRTVDLRLEDGNVKVGRETTAAGTAGTGMAAGATPLQIVEVTCTQEELTRGRALMSTDLLTAYQQGSETVPSDQRRNRFVVVPPQGLTSVSFVARVDPASAAFADLTTYVGDLIARYQP